MNKKTFEAAIEFATKEKGRYLIITENMPGANNEKFYNKVHTEKRDGWLYIKTEVVEVTEDFVHLFQETKMPCTTNSDKYHYFIPMEKIVAVEVNTTFEFNE